MRAPRATVPSSAGAAAAASAGDGDVRQRGRTTARGAAAVSTAASPPRPDPPVTATTARVRTVRAPRAAVLSSAGAAAAASAGDGDVRPRVRTTSVAAVAGATTDATSDTPSDDSTLDATTQHAAVGWKRQRGPTDGGESSPDVSTSDSDGSAPDDSSVSSAFSTVCIACHARVGVSDPGSCCAVRGCRVTKCHACLRTKEERERDFVCLQHGAAADAATADADRLKVATADPCTVARLPTMLRSAASRGIANALRELGDWKSDPDMCDIVDDLKETIGHVAKGTAAKGATAIRRLQEFISILPSRLSNATASHNIIDVVLADFVTRRTRRAKRSRLPPQWTEESAGIPQPQSVRNEVGSIIGLMRVAGLLPADPRGSIPKTRRTMRSCGCMKKSQASPRHYTFLWELIAAYQHGLATTSVSRFVVWALAVTAIHFLLRPRYARMVDDKEVAHVEGVRYRLEFARGDKTNQPHLPPAASAAAARTTPGGGGAADSASSASSDGDDDDAAREVVQRSVPTAHPRYTGSAGVWLHRAQRMWRKVRGHCNDKEPLFCRVEPARQTTKVPVGAVCTTFDGEKCYMWPNTKVSPYRIKKELVAMLTPIIGFPRARLRTAAGFRGGGEMELAELKKAVNVRATIGWWVARRIATEGQMVVYEGSSMEAMWEATSDLGTRFIHVLAPGVYTTTSPWTAARSVLRRAVTRRHPAPAP